MTPHLKVFFARCHVYICSPNHEFLAQRLLARHYILCGRLHRKGDGSRFAGDGPPRAAHRAPGGPALTPSECRSTCSPFRAEPKSGLCRTGVPRTPLLGVPSTRELGVP